MLMLPNPFIIAGAIPNEYFCDRVAETAKLVRFITNLNNVVLISSRRVGKTGLIDHCFNREEIKNNFNTVYFDILQTSSLQEFTYIFGRRVFEALAPRGKRFVDSFINTLKSLSGKFGYDAVSGAPSFSVQLGDISRPDYTLEEIFSFLDTLPLRCVIAIDEFQQITTYPEKNIEALLRSHIQRCSNCNFIFAGSIQHLITEMFVSNAKPFYRSASIMHLEPIPKPVYTEFVSSMFESYDKRVEKPEIERIYDMFDGVTFFLQSVLNVAFSATKAGGICSRATIDEAIDEIITDNEVTFRKLLATIPLRQKELLISIAKNDPATGITSASFMKANGLSSASSVQAAAKKLLEMSVISRLENRYSVTDKFLSLWLLRNY